MTGSGDGISDVEVAAGTAERLPVPPRSARGAWLSTVVRHVDDVPAAAPALRSTLVKDARVLIRGIFRDRFDPDMPLVHWFPEAAEVLATYPSVEETCRNFAGAGFRPVALEDVRQPVAPSPGDVLRRLRREADTLLRGISDEAFERGRRNLAAAARTSTEPVEACLSLLVLE
jgi:hypothetical protein